MCKLKRVILNCSYWVRLHAVEKFDLSVFCIFTGESSVLYTFICIKFKEELNTALKSSQEKLRKRENMKGEFEKTVQHIKARKQKQDSFSVHVYDHYTQL